MGSIIVVDAEIFVGVRVLELQVFVTVIFKINIIII